MTEPSGEHDHKEPHEGAEHPRFGGDGHTRRDHGERHRRRRKRAKATSNRTYLAFVALIVIVGTGLFFLIGPRVIRKAKVILQQREEGGTSRMFIKLTYRSVIVTNASSDDWGYTTVTVNTQYVAHCPDIPKGTTFEISLKDFRGPEGPFPPTAPTLRTVKIEPDGKPPIIWDRPMQ